MTHFSPTSIQEELSVLYALQYIQHTAPPSIWIKSDWVLGIHIYDTKHRRANAFLLIQTKSVIHNHRI
ncbi:MAG: hypothetical protein B7X93_09850 [Hydrogenophilales bacterium 17-61-9]|nr:MAG: hypothetical protein B7X93_09850 [Hydrogenophilales bacterium 17-61-9]